MAVISVSEVNLSVKACFDSGLFKNLEVLGEISGFKAVGAHAYFTLKDIDSQISCSCFSYKKTYVPKDGEQVIVKGSVDYYVKGGRLNFVVSSITPYGDGLLAQKFEALKKQLEKEGLFDLAHKKAIPQYNKNVLVLTSKTGAVIRDIVTTIKNKNPYIDIVVKDVRVQGEGVGVQIAQTLKKVDKLGYDVIIIARGGGSLEDLAPFYDEELARAVYEAKTPIVSAVGHETDFSLCDFVADKRAATPTAAAEIVAFDFMATIDYVKSLMKNATISLNKCYSNNLHLLEIRHAKFSKVGSEFYSKKQLKLNNTIMELASKSKSVLNKGIVKLKDFDNKLVVAIEKKLGNDEQKANRAISMLDSLSPLKTLKRGYFKISKGEKELNEIKSLKIGDKITAHGVDGNFEANIEKINLFKE